METLKYQQIALVLGLVFISLAQAQPVAQLPADVAKMIQDAKLPPESVGVFVVPVGKRNSQPVLSANSARSMQPASTIKLVTTAAALDILGPAARNEARLLTVVRPAASSAILDTPLFLRGQGSPDLTLQELRKMLEQMRSDGLQIIRSDLVIDRSWLQPMRPDVGTPAFDEAPEFPYNFIPDALSLDMNLLTIAIRSGADAVAAGGVIAETRPALEGIKIISTMTLRNAPCNRWEDKWQIPLVEEGPDNQTQITLRGEFPKNCKVETRLNLIDRTQYADRLFRTLWKELGGFYLGKTREASTAELNALELIANDPNSTAMAVLARHQSRPLSETMRDINKRSDNPTTRLLYLSLGAVSKKFASPAQSESAVRNWLRTKGIDDAGLVLDNGSGLSRSERITPYQLAMVLVNAFDGPWAPEFLASMPIIGLDGSMRNRLKSSVATQRGRIKTGGLRDVASIAGYVTDKNNQTHAVVAFINHPTAQSPASRAVLDSIIEWVAGN